MDDDDPRLCMYAELPYIWRHFYTALRDGLRLVYFRGLRAIRRRLPHRWRKYLWPRGLRQVRK